MYVHDTLSTGLDLFMLAPFEAAMMVTYLPKIVSELLSGVRMSASDVIGL